MDASRLTAEEIADIRALLLREEKTISMNDWLAYGRLPFWWNVVLSIFVFIVSLPGLLIGFAFPVAGMQHFGILQIDTCVPVFLGGCGCIFAGLMVASWVTRRRDN